MGLFSGIGSFFGGPLGGLLGGVGDEILGRNDAENANATAYAQQRQLRQTAYQDTTKDLQAAGLNPMLAYSNGATAAAGGPPVLNKGISSAQQNSAQASAANLNADTENKNAQRDLMEAQAAEVRSRIPMNTNSASNIEQQTKKTFQETDKIRNEIQLVINQTHNAVDQGNLMRAQQQLAEVQTKLAANTMNLQDAQAEMQKILTEVQSLGIPELTARAEYWLSEMGKKQPYAEGLEKMGDAAGSVIGGTINKIFKGKGRKK